MIRFGMLMALGSVASGLSAQTTPQAAERNQQQVATEVYQGAWAPAPPVAHGSSAEVEDVQFAPATQLTQLRVERNNALVQGQGSISAADKAKLDQQALAIEANSPNSFEAHMARYYSAFPAPAAFMHLDLAIARDRERPELIGPQLVKAARSDVPAEMSRWAQVMKEQGGIAAPLWAVADDMLLSVDRDAVLFAAGEMDAFPLWTRQFADGKRKDVLVVDHRLLNDPVYRQRVWARCKAANTVPTSGDGFIEALAGATSRPVYVSPALGRDQLQPLKGRLYATGYALRYSTAPFRNMEVLAANWSRLSKTVQAGPLSKNYLFVGAILLNHYRGEENEAKAAALEHELRALAKRLGATESMIRTGVFQH